MEAVIVEKMGKSMILPHESSLEIDDVNHTRLKKNL